MYQSHTTSWKLAICQSSGLLLRLCIVKLAHQNINYLNHQKKSSVALDFLFGLFYFTEMNILMIKIVCLKVVLNQNGSSN
jgi:hypothetical protein